MTARSELFVEDDVRDVVENILKSKGLLEDKEKFTVECPEDWCGIWSDAQFPDSGKAKILDNDDKPIGEVEWDVNFEIETDIGGRYIVAEPKITGLVWKGQKVI